MSGKESVHAFPLEGSNVPPSLTIVAAPLGGTASSTATSCFARVFVDAFAVTTGAPKTSSVRFGSANVKTSLPRVPKVLPEFRVVVVTVVVGGRPLYVTSCPSRYGSGASSTAGTRLGRGPGTGL